jgi:hypothetical protein
VIDFPDAEGPLEFSYDEEWLAVLRSTHGLLSLQRRAAPLPRGGLPPLVGEGELAEVRRRLAERGGGGEGAAAAVVPRNFVASVPAFDPDNPQMRQGRMPQVGGMARREGLSACLAGRGSAGGGRGPCICSQLALPACHPRLAAQHAQRNPQTEAFLGMLGLPYNLDHDAPAAAAGGGGGYGGGGFGGFGGGSPGGYGSGLAAAAAGMGPAVAIGAHHWHLLCAALLLCRCCEGGSRAGQHLSGADCMAACCHHHPTLRGAAEVSNPEEIELEDDDDDDFVDDGEEEEGGAAGEGQQRQQAAAPPLDAALAAVLQQGTAAAAANPEEIDLGEED